MCVYIAIQTARQLNNVKRRATFPLPSPTPSLATTTVATAAPSPFPALCLPSGAVNQPVELAALLPCCPRLSQTNHNCYNLLKAELGRRRNGERQGEREGGRNNCSKSIKLQGSAPAVAAVFCVMFARANRTMRSSLCLYSQREGKGRQAEGELLSWLSTFIK